LSIGPWAGANATERACFVFDHGTITGRPGFTLIDASASAFAGHDGVLGRMMSREAALESPLKREAFGILDAIGEQDSLLSGWMLDTQLH
jgi:hypothetical protein